MPDNVIAEKTDQNDSSLNSENLTRGQRYHRQLPSECDCKELLRLESSDYRSQSMQLAVRMSLKEVTSAR
jgi:hypothetical protein